VITRADGQLKCNLACASNVGQKVELQRRCWRAENQKINNKLRMCKKKAEIASLQARRLQKISGKAIKLLPDFDADIDNDDDDKKRRKKRQASFVPTREVFRQPGFGITQNLPGLVAQSSTNGNDIVMNRNARLSYINRPFMSIGSDVAALGAAAATGN